MSARHHYLDAVNEAHEDALKVLEHIRLRNQIAVAIGDVLAKAKTDGHITDVDEDFDFQEVTDDASVNQYEWILYAQDGEECHVHLDYARGYLTFDHGGTYGHRYKDNPLDLGRPDFLATLAKYIKEVHEETLARNEEEAYEYDEEDDDYIEDEPDDILEDDEEDEEDDQPADKMNTWIPKFWKGWWHT